MAPYDSDSSDGGKSDYTETNVLLGYAAKAPGDDTISHLGGNPSWLDPATPPPASFAKCKVCKDFMVLLLELNGDLPDRFPGHERRLYLWICRRKTCRRKEGSVRGFRASRVAETAASKDKQDKPAPATKVSSPGPAVNIGETLFGAKSSSNPPAGNSFLTGASSLNSSNPFSQPSSVNTAQNPFAAANLPSPSELAAKPPQKPSPTTSPNTSDDLPKTFASALSLDAESPNPTFGPPPPTEPWPQPSDLALAYPLYYLVDADYEVLEKIEDEPVPITNMDVDEPSSARGGGQGEDKEVFESSIDKTFQKFADRLAQNPEQVLRYEFGGNPLLYSKHDEAGRLLSSGSGGRNEKVKVSSGSGIGIPSCNNCGKRRSFEVQLTPHAIMELEREEEDIDGMDWGTIIMGVCEGDCIPRHVRPGEVGYVEEWAGVQWEETAVKM